MWIIAKKRRYLEAITNKSNKVAELIIKFAVYYIF